MKFSDSIWQAFKENGDLENFQALFKIYYEPLCRYSCVYTKNRMDTEEVVQDFFITLWKNRRKINIEGSFELYARQAVHNRSLNKIRSRKENASIEGIPNLQITDVHTIDSKILNELAWNAIASLPGKCQKIYLLSRKEGLSYQEIARLTGLSIKTVEGHMTRALKKIKEKLKKYL